MLKKLVILVALLGAIFAAPATQAVQAAGGSCTIFFWQSCEPGADQDAVCNDLCKNNGGSNPGCSGGSHAECNTGVHGCYCDDACGCPTP